MNRTISVTVGGQTISVAAVAASDLDARPMDRARLTNAVPRMRSLLDRLRAPLTRANSERIETQRARAHMAAHDLASFLLSGFIAPPSGMTADRFIAMLISDPAAIVALAEEVLAIVDVA